MSERLAFELQFFGLSNSQSVTTMPPGVAVRAAPRKTARGREKDTVLWCLHLRARGVVPAERYGDLLELATTTFFGSPGSVTAALRQALAAVNQKLLDWNLRETGPATPLQGGLMGVVVREGDLYAVQCGPGQLALARPQGLERFPLAGVHPTGRALGLSNTVDTHYFHAVVSAGEYVCVAPMAAPGWSEASLAGLGSLATASAVGERLCQTAGGDVAVWVARLEVHQAMPKSSPVAQASTSLRGGLSALLRAKVEAKVEEEVEEEEAEAATDWKELVERTEQIDDALPAPAPKVEAPPRANPLQPLGAGLRHGLRSLGRALTNTGDQINVVLRRLLARMLPGEQLQSGGMLAVPVAVQIAIALVIPLVVASIGAAVFWQEGRTRLFDDALARAQLAMASAQQAPDPAAARTAWHDALTFLAQAEAVRLDAQVETLRAEAQTQLDKLDEVTRLDYKPLVVGGLGAGVRLTRLMLIGDDVYALDQTGNTVVRLIPSANDTGYTQDKTFKCAGNRDIGAITLGTLIDIGVVAPPNVFGIDAILALDTTGGLMYCAPGLEPVASYLPAPSSGWIRPAGLELYNNRLYVLDPGSNQVWQFQDSGGSFARPPENYFTSAVYDLTDVIEFSIAGGDVFLLRRSGRVTTCTRAGPGADPICQLALNYTDPRAGRAPGETLADVTRPVLLQYAPPPEPSLYLLDSDSGGIYQLSLKLTFTNQFRPRTVWLDPAEAFTLDAAKRLFVAAGNNVYVAAQP